MFKRIKVVDDREKDHSTTQKYHGHDSAVDYVPHRFLQIYKVKITFLEKILQIPILR